MAHECDRQTDRQTERHLAIARSNGVRRVLKGLTSRSVSQVLIAAIMFELLSWALACLVLISRLSSNSHFVLDSVWVEWVHMSHWAPFNHGLLCTSAINLGLHGFTSQSTNNRTIRSRDSHLWSYSSSLQAPTCKFFYRGEPSRLSSFSLFFPFFPFSLSDGSHGFLRPCPDLIGHHFFVLFSFFSFFCVHVID